MESSLETLNRQEEKYTAELDAALAQYAGLQQQAADMDTSELEAARQMIRPVKGHEAAQRLQDTYRKKFDSNLLTQSQKDVADLLDEVAEPVSIREKFRQPYTQQAKRHHTKNNLFQER